MTASRLFEKSADPSASRQAVQTLKFEREDWSIFRTLEGLQQKAGVPIRKLIRLVMKEIADNGLDNGAAVRVGHLGDGHYFVKDDGPGIDGEPEEIARLFSIARPMMSTKLLRLPTRGALGNGLRVVAGAVLASEGALVVITRNRRITLRPERDGTTTVVSVKTVDFPRGTRVEITFGPALPQHQHDLSWAQTAIRLARTGTMYGGRSSPWWYDAAAFHELLSASTAPVRELVASLDGCSGAKAGEIVDQAGVTIRKLCRDLDRDQATNLLLVARVYARPVKPKRLGIIGDFFGSNYAIATGVAEFGSGQPRAEIPFVVEAWANVIDEMAMAFYVNRTPITGEIVIAREKREINLFGCGLANTIAKAPPEARFGITINVTTPYMPITSDGKEPDLVYFFDEIEKAATKAVRMAHRPSAKGNKNQKTVVLDHLDEVIAAVSGDGEFRFNQRQLLYGLRPIVMKELDQELKADNFARIITDYESEHGEIELMYREPRGTITHPHRDETITLGTLMVEEYARPEWTFNKLLYIEKEGFSEALKAVRWGERHDCAMLSSKGFSTRAARDLIDKLAAHGESIKVFCVHDGDAPGTMIYQTLQEATKARAARKIEIINLGLEPWEGLDMRLDVENIERGSQRKPVADYVFDHDEDGKWVEWLQTHRIEINAMTTPQFISWLDLKMAKHRGKVMPPPDVLESELEQRIEIIVRNAVTERILREAGIEEQVAARLAAIKRPSGATIAKDIKRAFKREPDSEWRDHIEVIAKKVR